MELGNIMDHYLLTSLATLLAAFVLFFAMVNVGKARGKYEVQVPSTDGPEGFLRAFRAHANTVEQAVMFLPAMWVLALVVDDMYAGIIGIIWAASRVLFISSYSAEAKKRGPWFMTGFLCFVVTFLWALGAVIMKLLDI